MAVKNDITNKEALATLQAELLSLKERFQGALHLHKASVALDGSSGPFPIRVSLLVKAPAAAAAYDVQDFKVIVTLSAASTDQTLTASSRVQGVTLRIQSAELPHILKERMAERLKASWVTAVGQGLDNSMHLGVIFDSAQQDFVSLLTLLPELVEAYESVDTQGASARRYAIVDPESHIEVVESSQTHSADGHGNTSNPRSALHSQEGLTWLEKATTAGAKSEPTEEQRPLPSFSGQLFTKEEAIRQPAEPASASAAQGLRGEQQTLMAAAMPAYESVQAQQPGTSGISLASFPKQAQPEIIFLQRRYRQSVTLLPKDGPCFVLQLEPTDPSWQRGKRLHLRGKVAATYPAVGSLELSCAQTPDLDPDVCTMLDRILAAHIAALGGWKQGHGAVKYDLLRRVVREIDNSGGQFLHLAQDVLLQNARRAQPCSASSAASVHVSASTAASMRRKQSHEGHSAGKANGVAESVGNAPGPSPESRALGVDGGVQAVAGLATLDLSGSFEHDTDSVSSTDEEDGTDEDWETGSTSSQDQEGGGHVPSERGGFLGAPEMGNSSLEMHLDGLKLDNIDALEILRLNLQVACSRCGALSEVGLATEAAAAGQLEQVGACSTCSQAWSVGMRPLLVHAHSSCLARIKTEGCAPRDLLPSLYAAQCGGCSSIASFRSVQVGATCERNCSNCHMAMGISFSTARFQQHAHAPGVQRANGPRTGGSQRGAGAPRAAGGSAPLQPGQPLPNLGTCKHYAHSYRLLRFPCCGRRFSCDLCHEEATDGHEMKWAHRMVCGFCSVEQALGDRCKHCNKKLAHNASGAVGNRTRHWEGGEGCRNKKLLDRRDAAKYRNSKFKTVSKKSSRVGQEGARRRKKAAAS